MGNTPYEGPVYNPQFWSSAERGVIRKNNMAVLGNAFDRLTVPPFKKGTDASSVIRFKGMSINTKMPTDFEYNLALDFNEEGASILFRDSTMFELGNVAFNMNRMKVHGTEAVAISNSDVAVNVGFEGNGIGTALALGSEKRIPDLLKSVGHSTKPIIYSLYMAQSHLAAAKPGTDARTGWTPTLLTSLGYTDDKEIVGRYTHVDLLDKGHYFVKVWKDAERGIDLLKSEQLPLTLPVQK